MTDMGDLVIVMVALDEEVNVFDVVRQMLCKALSIHTARYTAQNLILIPCTVYAPCTDADIHSSKG